MAIKKYYISDKDTAIIEFDDGKDYSYVTRSDSYIMKNFIDYLDFCRDNNKTIETLNELCAHLDAFYIYRDGKSIKK